MVPIQPGPLNIIDSFKLDENIFSSKIVKFSIFGL